MNLLDIRQEIVRLSGRYDLLLIKEGMSIEDMLMAEDNGANFKINSACRYLDITQEQYNSLAYYETTMAAAEYYVRLKWCRTVKSVYIKSDEGWVPLEVKTINELMEDYPELEDTDADTPLYFAVYPLIRDPNNKSANEALNEVGVMVIPPTDTELQVKVYGLFFSPELKNNEDENYWSDMYPDLLVKATLREIEIGNRNSQGVNDFDKAIAPILHGIDKDLADYSTMDSMEMGG